MFKYKKRVIFALLMVCSTNGWAADVPRITYTGERAFPCIAIEETRVECTGEMRRVYVDAYRWENGELTKINVHNWLGYLKHEAFDAMLKRNEYIWWQLPSFSASYAIVFGTTDPKVCDQWAAAKRAKKRRCASARDCAIQ